MTKILIKAGDVFVGQIVGVIVVKQVSGPDEALVFLFVCFLFVCCCFLCLFVCFFFCCLFVFCLFVCLFFVVVFFFFGGGGSWYLCFSLILLKYFNSMSDQSVS